MVVQSCKTLPINIDKNIWGTCMRMGLKVLGQVKKNAVLDGLNLVL
jgi:hypothetical protein